MAFLFQKEIPDWDAWGGLFQSIPDFAPLIEAIRQKEALPEGAIENLTPGTNAVFACGKLVYKIYAPLFSTSDATREYDTELFGLRFAQSLGVSSPHVVAAGELQDRYLFRYFVMDRLEGPEAGPVLKTLDPAAKSRFAAELRCLLQLWNRPLPEKHPLKRVSLAGDGQDWNMFGDSIARELDELNREGFFSEPLCYVHGDLTAQNVLMDGQNRPLPIDFADSRCAPAFYELPPVLFDLFDFDPELIRLFCADGDPAVLADRAFCGILLHEFGASCAEIICNRFLQCEADELKSIFLIRDFLQKYIAECVSSGS
ncbi:MAG: aminoglycoside phosphotransferase family protein [Firmicutes bacterium]|nr:aminoglycoside phosphotransferase family protein [Bacillota bacterium]